MPPLVVIVGETASGKSALAHELAKRLNGEIISADSWAVYKGFDIGTAKPSAAERAEVAYHLIDVADPLEGFSAVLFKRLAVNAIQSIVSRGKLPIMVGGTGLYIDSVLFDYSFLPATSPELRQELNALSLSEVLQRARELGLDMDGIDLRNKRRVIRLIENNGARPTRRHALRENTLILGLRRKQEDLHERIERRVDAMVAAGFADEVQRLGERYGWDCEPMKAPGYRAFADYVQGKVTLSVAKERFRQNDLKLAKKQRTWFKRNSGIHWLNNRDEIAQSVELITTLLNT
ncbi:MAG TPA: tRNA (adenosine(37)-N6)-dimethylallyltransferase MiaA [Candidatus Saccharimonadales bacterium]